jgi:hypothetical protein
VCVRRHGYTALTFITDGNKQFTCGSKAARWVSDSNGNGPEQQLQDDVLARNLNNTLITRNTTTGENIRLQFVEDLEEPEEEPLAINGDDRSARATRASSRREARMTRRAARRQASRSLLVDGPQADTSAAKPATWWWFDWGHGNGNQQPDQK